MAQKTTLEKKSYEDINKLSEKELKKITKNAIKASLRRIDKIEKSGYDVSDYNETFLDESNNWNLSKASLNETRRIASYVKRHMESKFSSVEGLRQRDEEGLRLLSKLAGNENYNDVKIRRGKNFTYRMQGRTYTRDELSEFWSIVRKVDEDNSLQRLKEGSGGGIQTISTIVFEKNIRNPSEILSMIKDKYKQEQLEIAKKRMEYEEELERIKRNGRKYQN